MQEETTDYASLLWSERGGQRYTEKGSWTVGTHLPGTGGVAAASQLRGEQAEKLGPSCIPSLACLCPIRKMKTLSCC